MVFPNSVYNAFLCLYDALENRGQHVQEKRGRSKVAFLPYERLYYCHDTTRKLPPLSPSSYLWSSRQLNTRCLMQLLICRWTIASMKRARAMVTPVTERDVHVWRDKFAAWRYTLNSKPILIPLFSLGPLEPLSHHSLTLVSLALVLVKLTGDDPHSRPTCPQTHRSPVLSLHVTV